MTPDDVWKLAPEWATFIAQDPDGAWLAFELRPKPLIGRWKARKTSRVAQLTKPIVPNWTSTLQERPR